MKVLAYSAYYTPEIAASMYLVEDIYRGIVNAGHTLEVYVPAPARGVSEEVRSEYRRKKVEKKYGGRMTVHRIALYREGTNYFHRAVRYLLMNLAFIWKGLRTEADVVFVQSTPPTQGMMAGIVCGIKRIPWVYNLQDIFPESLVNANMVREGGLIWRLGRMVENFSYRHAGRIIVISEDFKRNIMGKGVPEEKIAVVPNWADTGGVYPVARKDNVLLGRYQLDPDRFYITYCGNVGYTQNMDLLLEAAKAMRDDWRNLTFLIIGDGADRERVQKRALDERIDNVRFLPFQPYEDIAHVFSLGDVGLVISKPGVGRHSVPSKIWNIMASGKPVLASFDRDSELCRLIESVGCGVCTDDLSLESLCGAITRMMKERRTLEAMGKRGLDYLRRDMDRETAVAQYVNLLSFGLAGPET